MQAAPTQENRILAALGYPIFIVALIVLFTDLKTNRFMRVHAIQALGYAAAWVIIWIAALIISGIPFLGWALFFLWPLLYLAWVVLSIYYAYRTYQGEMFRIPIVSDYTSKYAG